MDTTRKLETSEKTRPSLPSLTIGKNTSETNIVQGGMGVGISNWRLAGTVSKEGGIGTLSSVGLPGMPEYIDLFRKHVRLARGTRARLDPGELAEVFQQVNALCIKEEIRKAREICGDKPLFINIMHAVNGYEDQVRAACEAGINGIVSGAGIPLELPALTADYPDVAIMPILSNAKGVGTITKMWKKHGRTPAAIIFEDPSKAAGHIGTNNRSLDQVDNHETQLHISVPRGRETLDSMGLSHIPIIAGGGAGTREHVDHILSLGAAGIQMGTRFLGSDESHASTDFKQALLRAKNRDIIVYISDLPIPARALAESPVFQDAVDIRAVPHHCEINCLKHCGLRDGIQGTTQMCIWNRLTAAVEGSRGTSPLYFSGTIAAEIDTIMSVHDILEGLR